RQAALRRALGAARLRGLRAARPAPRRSRGGDRFDCGARVDGPAGMFPARRSRLLSEYPVAMRMLQALCCGAVGALLIAQARPARPGRSKSRADGGTVILGTDPPGRLRPAAAAATDGGVAQADAGPDATQRQIQELRARVDLLERQLAQSQQQGQQLQQISAELQQLRQQVANAESQRQAAEQQRESRRQQVQSSVDALYQAQPALPCGSCDIDGPVD